ncbi:hypothetical protein SAMN04515667_1817 [Formosa sp. Hel1_31_208]|uniref:hypothetical protein n=1 Tax=Formosa sp. Hel1_31_208 TaxID=1798225 RepID=UPI00087D0B24|nr:hypothetical protein [Formosa sp. Hel1_31_208]SDS27923.1 hypothetical protein SAMN04515667_1817 [Formosa sp. Hel1_31_208]
MKKLAYLFCLFMLLSAFTCEDEPLEDGITNEVASDTSSLIGTWTLVSMEADINIDTNFAGIDFSSEFNAEVTNSDYNLVFTAANYTVSGDYEMTITSTFEGETTSYTDSYTDVSGSGTYSTNGNVMTIDGSFIEFDFEGMPMDVAQGEQTAQFELSSDGQTLTFLQDEIQTQNEAGLVATIATVSESVWQKVE